MIVISTREKYEVGKRYEDVIRDKEGVPHTIPFIVVKESTIEEYRKDLIKHGASTVHIDNEDIRRIYQLNHFFWIQMD